MSALSNYAENLAGNWLFNTESVTRPTAWYVALFTDDPTDAGSGTEVSGSGYGREAVTFAAFSGGASSNTGAVTFTASGGSWGTITHAGIYDASSTGNLLAHGALSASKAIGDGDSLEFAIGDIDLVMA